ncbi:MAG TPA: VOC family protein [Verrucomicrobiae bacterium]|nr:VOC family protein [Verrucomicrobiae bacterium]
MHPIVWFDIRAANVKRAQRFYGRLFGWKFEQLPGMEYWRIDLGGTSALNKGGLGKGDKRRTSYLNFILVPSVARFVTKAKKLGGKIVTPRTVVPGHGVFAVCRDTENNVFALWETARKAK